MKIEIIKKEGNYYTVTLTPSFFGWLFGKRKKEIRVKDIGNVYYYFNHISVFMDENGCILSPISDLCNELNKFKNKQTF